jgi:hypothetical protein
VYHPEYKGIRLDVLAKDENHSRYNVEMQVVKSEIFKRSRYYHSQMDMECMLTGTEYEELPDSYVIFICDFDPVGLGKFLHFVGANLTESTEDFGDSLVRRLQESITRIKASREMGERYMLFEELLKDEFSAGKKEGRTEGVVQSIIDVLPTNGTVPEELCAKLRSCSDMELLRDLVKRAAKAESVSAFEAELDNLLK